MEDPQVAAFQKSQTLDSARILPRRTKPTNYIFYPDWVIVREIAQHVRGSLLEAGHGKLLDVGCGEKPYEVYRTPEITEWVGLDLQENPTADVYGSADALPFKGSAFQTILCTEVLEHLSEPAAAVTEMARVLSPGGVVILTTPLYYPLHEEPHDYFRFTPYGLRYLFEKAGFQIETLKPMATGLRVVALAANKTVNMAGKRFPGGHSWMGKAVLTPFYLASNLAAVLLSGVIQDPRNAVGIALTARKL